MIIFGKPIHTHNIICYVFMLLGVGLIYFGVEGGDGLNLAIVI